MGKYNIDKTKIQNCIMYVLNMISRVNPLYYDEFALQINELIQKGKYDDVVDIIKDTIYMPLKAGKEPTAIDLKNYIEKEDIILTEKFLIKHLSTNGKEAVTIKEITCFPVEIRRAQQLSMKENMSADNDKERNISGQASGDAKSGTFSAPQLANILSVSPDPFNSAIAKELLGPASDNLNAKKQAMDMIYKDGEYSLSKIKQVDDSDRISLVMMNGYLRAMGYQTDLLEPIVK